MKKLYSSFLFLLLLIPVSSFSQGLESGNDPMGKPHRPVTGLLAPLINPKVPQELGKKLTVSFQRGMGGSSVSTPYGLVNKSKVEKAASYAVQTGASKKELRKYYYWASVGCQTLFRAEINSWKLEDDLDSIYTTTRAVRKFDRIAKYKVGSVNMTVRFFLLMYHRLLGQHFQNDSISHDKRILFYKLHHFLLCVQKQC